MIRACLLPLLLLAACASDVPVRYVGSLTRTSGSCTNSSATLVRRGDAVSFAPSDGALVLLGTVGPDGHLQANATGPGLNRVPFVMQLDGQLTADGFSGHYRTPACRAVVVLQA